MTRDEIIAAVSDTINRVLSDKGDDPAEIDADTVLIGGELAIDSLDLATIVVELEGTTGKDPFAAGFIEFSTVGELADLYA